ncbi:MAG: exonuclease subunit SbcD [Spirochaetaceae bacterium]|nr:exonuclease subunit SbcD [Spirochaetaceae bacterium]
MKFLHTADLHLGKVFHEHSLIEDQRYMLDRLAEILSDGSIAALLIAGDVYDRSIPSPGAVSLFSAFLGKVKARRPDMQVLILPGNHDSSSRLGFGRELFAELGVHFVTRPEDAFRPVLVTTGGPGTRSETCAFFLLPFLHPGSLRAEMTGGKDEGGEAEPLRSQVRLAEEAAARLEAARREALAAGADYAALGAHLFAAGGAESESERVFLGATERVPADLFASFDYTAMGHLHRFQQAGERAWYSGSPLAYSFEEGRYEKVFLLVELERKNPESASETPPKPALSVEPAAMRPMRKMRSIRGSFDYFFRDEARDPLLKEAETDYLEAVLTDPGLTENPLVLLRRRFPWILSVKQEAAFAALLEARPGTVPGPNAGTPKPGERRSPVEDFEDFLGEIYGGEDPDRDEKTAAFKELLDELEKSEEEPTGGEQ